MKSAPDIWNEVFAWHWIETVSNCLPSQVLATRQGRLSRAMAFRMTSSFPMQAVSATFRGFPAARSR